MRSVDQIVKSTQETFKRATGEGEKKAIQITALIAEKIRRLIDRKETTDDKSKTVDKLIR